MRYLGMRPWSCRYRCSSVAERPDCRMKCGPIVLIWGREPEAVAALLIAFRSLAEAQGREVALHVEVPGVQAVGCQVFAVNRQATWLHPEGVYALKAKGTFSWCRDSEGWLEVADKVESFLAGISAGQTNIYQ